MKPIHEQEWVIRNTNIGSIIEDVSADADGDSICMVYTPMSYSKRRLTLEQSVALRDARAAAITALPDAVRALLMVLHRQGDADSRERAARDVLRKMGVIP